MVCFVERLTVKEWFFCILPRLATSRFQVCYVIDASPVSMKIAQFFSWLMGFTIETLVFRFVDVKDEDGELVGRRIFYEDIAEVQQYIVDHSVLRRLDERVVLPDYLRFFFTKNAVSRGISDSNSIEYILYLIQVVAWKINIEGLEREQAVFFLIKRPWIDAVVKYASKNGIHTKVLPFKLKWNWRKDIKLFLGYRLLDKLRFFQRKLRSLNKGQVVVSRSTLDFPPSKCYIATEYYGQFNIEDPSRYSDFFFWQQSDIKEENLLFAFNFPNDPLDKKKWATLLELGIAAVAMNQDICTHDEAPVFIPDYHPIREIDNVYDRLRDLKRESRIDIHWIKEQLLNYRDLRSYWESFFLRHQVKIFLTYYKYDGCHYAISDAMQHIGGISVMYQRAHEEFSSPGTHISVDVEFGFSKHHAFLERSAGSVVPYYVVTGYIGDHRFALLKEQARELRQSLIKNGAKRIIAFFDENSMPDTRWHTGHELVQSDYLFLLEKLLAEPDLGLVLKPKTPTTLRQRLGPVNELLVRAQATGRCHLYETGVMQSAYPPALAALSADIAVHGFLQAATAGFEAALAGVPTLLLDRENLYQSQFYELGKDRVVFSDWQTLWDACLQYWIEPNELSRLGDWAPILDNMDPFRDGRAAERMGTYLKWLIEGFERNECRETILANAAERYCQMWGNDKIIAVNSC